MKHKPSFIGLFQALGLVAYVFFIASIIQTISNFAPDREAGPLLGASLFLFLFVTSALICAAIAFGRPFFLFFSENKKREAFEAVGWTIVWLFVFGLTLGVGIILFW